MNKKYKRKDCTHILFCRHCIGPNCREYTMPCILLKKMKDGRLKVLVFGDRNWSYDLEKKRIRYIAAYRVIKKAD